MAIKIGTALAHFNIAMAAMNAATKDAATALAVITKHTAETVAYKDDNGRLTDAGKDALKAYWANDVSAMAAARYVGISGKVAWEYFRKWTKEWEAEQAA
jgi:hypothetical protein